MDLLYRSKTKSWSQKTIGILGPGNLRNSLKTQSDFARWFALSQDETQAFQAGEEIFNIRTTPYYASLCRSHSEDPLRRILMPSAAELKMGAQSQLDPLAEKIHNPAPRIIHRYPDRVLFLVTDICSVYCRFCTRKHFTGQEQAFIKEAEYAAALQYLRVHGGVREVILSGGDPLTLSDSQLSRVLQDLRKIEHARNHPHRHAHAGGLSNACHSRS